ncbi:hypothetical protein D3C81_1590970 [compost metagenome]
MHSFDITFRITLLDSLIDKQVGIKIVLSFRSKECFISEIFSSVYIFVFGNQFLIPNISKVFYFGAFDFLIEACSGKMEVYFVIFAQER